MSEGHMRVLLVEDDSTLVSLVANYLAACEAQVFDLVSAGSLGKGLESLEEGGVDAVLLDLGLPDSSGANGVAKIRQRFPAVPIVVLPAQEDEGLGLELVHGGAQDYLLKTEVTPPLLLRALRYAVERQRAAAERERLVDELSRALAEVKILSGFLPICAHCKKIRDDKGYWEQIESYISRHSAARFSHGLCPACVKLFWNEG